MTARVALSGLALAASLAACVQVDPKPDFDDARALVTETTGLEAVYDPAVPPPTSAELNTLLADGLTLDEAQYLALVNSRELQAEFHRLGAAHAGWVQSRLLANPSLDLLVRLPADGGRAMLEATLGFGLLELWRVPVAQRAARREVEASVLYVARLAAEQLASARTAYFRAVAADARAEQAYAEVVLARRGYALADERRVLGTADALDLALARAPVLTAELGRDKARREAADARRELAKHLSLWHPLEDVILPTPLPIGPVGPLEAEALVDGALASRTDLRALERSIEALEERVRFERRRAFGDAEVGLSYERSPEGDDLVGPSLGLELPVFDQNQAQVARAEFELAAALAMRDAARVAVAQDVRSAVDRLVSAADQLERYRSELEPQAERAFELGREATAQGQSTRAELLELEAAALAIRRARLDAELELALARVALERQLGAPVDV